MRWTCFSILVAIAIGSASGASAQNAVTVIEARLDRSTLTTLGVQVLISGDADFDATATMQYREPGGTLRSALPLFRVHPERVVGRTVPAQFAGSAFDLRPGTAYELVIEVADPDGGSATRMLTTRTRDVPRDPATPRAVSVSNAAELRTALAAARAGDVITLANGTYAGTFSITASGTNENPIVVRGGSQTDVVLDGGGTDGNIVEVYGSFVHVENLTLRNATRAFRFQGNGTEGNVARRLRIRDVRLGIGAGTAQRDFYIADNDIEGRLRWPANYQDNGGANANDDGIRIVGGGHVVAHNRVIGFGDAIKTEEAGARAIDVYGNETQSAYDNAFEFDAAEGNVRAFRNRFLNSYSPLSFQPVYGGPVYAFRNVIVNVIAAQMKLNSLGGTQEPSGVLIFHNTFVAAHRAIFTSAAAAVHDYQVMNNLFVGPTSPAGGLTVEWDTPIDFATARIDYNAYYPEGAFQYGYGATGMRYPSFAMVQAGGRYEAHGVLLTTPLFGSSLAPLAEHRTSVAGVPVTLGSTSLAIDRGQRLPNINDGFMGSAPDIGAAELGCAEPIYGVRPVGVDEATERSACGSAMPAGDAGVPVDATLPTDAATERPDGAPSTTDSGTPTDASRTTDAARGSGGATSGGCACSVAASGSSKPVPRFLVFLVMTWSVAHSRRRHSARAQQRVDGHASERAA